MDDIIKKENPYQKSVRGDLLSNSSVGLLDESRLFASGIVLVQQTAGGSLVNLLHSNADDLVLVSSTGLDGGVRLLDGGLQSRHSGLVLRRLGGDDLHALFGGFDIGHGDTSSRISLNHAENIIPHFAEKCNPFLQNISIFFANTACITAESGEFMDFQSDLAIEWNIARGCQGVNLDTRTHDGVRLTRIDITTQTASQQLQRPIGTYLTLEFPPLTETEAAYDGYTQILAEQITALLPAASPVLVAGIGNRRITPDALGPMTADMVLATRHISAEFARSCGLEDLRPTAVIIPGVLGQTGIESSEILHALCENVRPGAVIVVDALAARLASRIGCTVQINNTGISPGSGVGNHRRAIDKKALGVPVVAIGVPTVVNAATLVREFSDAEDIDAACRNMVVTPREIDILVQRAARLMAYSINRVLQPSYEPGELAAIANS